MTLYSIPGGGGFDNPAWKRMLRANKSFVPVKSHDNVRIILRNHPQFAGKLRLNEFSCRIEITDAPFGKRGTRQWEDDDSDSLVSWIDQQIQVDFSRSMVASGVKIAAREDSYHPVKDYLGRLEWDGVERIGRFFTDCFGVIDNPTTRGIASRWLVSGVARIMEPGCKVDCLIVLEGAQGAGKSSGLRALFGDQWYSDSEIPLGKSDSYAMLRGKWGIEIAEFGHFSRQEQHQIKRYISAPIDTFRKSYGEFHNDAERQSIFCATTNDDHWNHDATGARRYWPMKVGQCSPKLVSDIRDQVWAEALSLYRSGFKWWVDSLEFAKLMQAEQEARYEAHPWEDDIRALSDGKERMSAQEVFISLDLEPKHRTPADARVINGILSRLGYQTEVMYRLPSGKQVKGRTR